MVTQGGMDGDNDELFLCIVGKGKASRISDTLRVGFESVQNLSSGFATL